MRMKSRNIKNTNRHKYSLELFPVDEAELDDFHLICKNSFGPAGTHLMGGRWVKENYCVRFQNEDDRNWIILACS